MDQEGKVKLVEPEGLVFEVVEPIKRKLKSSPGVGLPVTGRKCENSKRFKTLPGASASVCSVTGRMSRLVVSATYSNMRARGKEGRVSSPCRVVDD
ncbi:hypothetical protein E2C01_049412 [Portunus trituberculatus]|uniref:Uncharacterized protein n=1 Tax=Portunus trituberculatus TaxID=210409 RepID=A0A5B7GG00_PORTR|nr:hypothetical protein [Portunus trituberculatus]